MISYYCNCCRHIVPVQETVDSEPYEFWGTLGYTYDIIYQCGLCGSHEVEELKNEENII